MEEGIQWTRSGVKGVAAGEDMSWGAYHLLLQMWSREGGFSVGLQAEAERGPARTGNQPKGRRRLEVFFPLGLAHVRVHTRPLIVFHPVPPLPP